MFRIALGSAFLLDLVLRARDLQMYYGDDGVLSRALFLQQSWLLSEYQPFLATGSTWGLTLFFLLGGAAGVSFLLGHRTRLAALLCWLFTVALQLRNPLVLDGGDEILRLLLFWCPLLPLSARWSFDAKDHPEWKRLPNRYRSVATAGIYVQFSLLYFFAAFLKTGADWTETGQALYYTLSIDQFATHLGKRLLEYPELLQSLTTVVLWGEFALAFLVLLPPKWLWPRLLFLLAAGGFHVGIGASLHFGIFMFIMVCGLTAFLPEGLLDRWFPPVEETETGNDDPPAYKLTPLENVFGGFILFYLFFVNIQSVEHRHKLPGWTMAVARVTFEHQHWHLFAPIPFRDDGWFVFEVTDGSGQVWREFASQELGLDKPGHVSTTFPNQRWRRWFQNLVRDPSEDTQSWRNATAFYLAKQWMEAHPTLQLKSYRLLFMEEMTPPPGEEAKVELRVLAESIKS